MKPTFRLLASRLAGLSRATREIADDFQSLPWALADRIRAYADILADLSEQAHAQRKRDALPKGQARVLTFVRQFKERHGHAPTRQEIANALGFASPNAAQDHLKRLAAKGVITLGEFDARAIRLNKRSAL